MGRHPAADAALFLCVFGRWVGCAYLGRWEPVPGPAGGLFGPSGREQERAERGRNRPRGGAGEGKFAEVWSEGWWRAAGRCAEGVASRRRGGGSWRRGVAGEHAARGHCLTGIEPLRGSTTSFSVTSGARSPAAFRPRWPLSAPLIASAPVPAPALFLRHVPVPAPGASLSPLPARPVPAPGSCPRCIQAGPCCRICAKKTPGPQKEGSGVEFRSAREAASPSMRWITSLRQVPGA